MRRSNPQAQVALLAGLVFLLVGLALVAVLVAGLAGGGLSATGPILLGALAIGVFALSARLFLLSRRPRVKPTPRDGLGAIGFSGQTAPPAPRAGDAPSDAPAGRIRPTPRPKGSTRL